MPNSFMAVFKENPKLFQVAGFFGNLGAFLGQPALFGFGQAERQ
jgi:hypothetical protein